MMTQTFEQWADENPEFAQPFPQPYVKPTDTDRWMRVATTGYMAITNDGYNDYKFTISEIISLAEENDLDALLRLIQMGKL